MAKHTLKILRRSHRKIFKVCLAILHIMHERVNARCPLKSNTHLNKSTLNKLRMCDLLVNTRLWRVKATFELLKVQYIEL